MKKAVSILMVAVLCLGLFVGCGAQPANRVSPLPQAMDVNHLDNCTVAVSFEQGDVFVDDSGKAVVKATVYSYECYDLAEISALNEGDVIVRRGIEVEVKELERLESGLVRVNGGIEAGGFDLITDESTVYYEVLMDNAKAYYELGEATLPISTEFVYSDESNPDAEAKMYYPGDFLTDAGIAYDFTPYNTSIVIENGVVTHMTKVFRP